jgi:hypothetical protein
MALQHATTGAIWVNDHHFAVWCKRCGQASLCKFQLHTDEFTHAGGGRTTKRWLCFECAAADNGRRPRADLYNRYWAKGWEEDTYVNLWVPLLPRFPQVLEPWSPTPVAGQPSAAPSRAAALALPDRTLEERVEALEQQVAALVAQLRERG